jgi:hypothetical protein
MNIDSQKSRDMKYMDYSCKLQRETIIVAGQSREQRLKLNGMLGSQEWA